MNKAQEVLETFKMSEVRFGADKVTDTLQRMASSKYGVDDLVFDSPTGTGGPDFTITSSLTGAQWTDLLDDAAFERYRTRLTGKVMEFYAAMRSDIPGGAK